MDHNPQGGAWYGEEFNEERYRQIQEEEDDELFETVERMFAASTNQSDEEEGKGNAEAEDNGQPVLKKRRKAKKTVMFTEADGSKRPIRCRDTMWYNCYVQNPNLDDDDFHKNFRKRFRLPSPPTIMRFLVLQ